MHRQVYLCYDDILRHCAPEDIITDPWCSSYRPMDKFRKDQIRYQLQRQLRQTLTVQFRIARSKLASDFLRYKFEVWLRFVNSHRSIEVNEALPKIWISNSVAKICAQRTFAEYRLASEATRLEFSSPPEDTMTFARKRRHDEMDLPLAQRPCLGVIEGPFLPTDVLLEVLDYLTLSDLAAVSLLNKFHSALVSGIFSRRITLWEAQSLNSPDWPAFSFANSLYILNKLPDGHSLVRSFVRCNFGSRSAVHSALLDDAIYNDLHLARILIEETGLNLNYCTAEPCEYRERMDLDWEHFSMTSPLRRQIVMKNDTAVQLLLNHGADVHFYPEASFLFQDICMTNNCNMLKIMCAAGYSPSMEDFLEAIRWRKLTILEFLFDYGLDVNATLPDGDTPLCAAFDILSLQSSEIWLIRRLLEEGADPNSVGSTGTTPLCLAVRIGHLAAIRLLRNAGADPNTRSKDGQTALLTAVIYGRVTVLRELLKRGVRTQPIEVDLEIATTAGITPLSLAVQLGFEKGAELLRKAGAKISSAAPE